MDIDDEIKELSKEKLLIEVKNLKRKSWKNFEHLISLLKFVAGAITIAASVLLAYYAIKTGILEIRKEKLQKEIADFEIQKSRIHDSLRIYRDSLTQIGISLKEQTQELTSINSSFAAERSKFKNLEIEKIYNLFRYYDPYEIDKLNTNQQLYNKFFDDQRGTLILVGVQYNSLKMENFNYDLDEIFPKAKYVDLTKVAQLSKITINKNDSLFIRFEITDTLLKTYSSPIIVYIKNNNKIIYSGIYTTRRVAKVCKCSEENIAINVKGLKPMKYEVTYGLFHQGSLIEYSTKLFYSRKEQIEIK